MVCHKKKDLQALELKRADVAELRHVRITKRQPFMANHLERLVFIDETWVKTNMAKTTGWAPRGQRLVDHAPFGHWRTQSFVGALRHDRVDAPWVIDGAMNGVMFDLCVSTQPVPTLRKGDVVILDNLSSLKSPGAARTLRDIGAWFRCSGKRPTEAFLIPPTSRHIVQTSILLRWHSQS